MQRNYVWLDTKQYAMILTVSILGREILKYSMTASNNII